jgi:tetratricopeptide (TPR) repeat protein
VHKELTKVHGKDRGDRSWRLFRRAAGEFEREQFQDAERTLKPLVEANPGLADMRELYGLALYRLGKWDLAMEQLEQFRAEAGTVEQHPVLMDLHRALGNWGDVDELWAELGEVSPDAALMSEGRIVAAGTEADRGNVDEGIRILEKGWKIPAKPLEHHLRRAYALADLYERRGKIPRARKLFNWLAGVSPPFGDAQDRARSLD